MITRAAAGALLGAILASAALVFSTRLFSSIVLDFDADLPRQVTSGFYPAERTPSETFVWTTQTATVNLRGLDRDVPWQCVVTLRAARPADVPRPEVALGVDGLTQRTHAPGDSYEDLEVEAAARPGTAGLSLTIATTPTFVPSAEDTRQLGVQIDRIVCGPSTGAWVSPPRGALLAVSVAGVAFGVVFALLSPTLIVALGWSAMFAVGLAYAVTAGVAAHSAAYIDWITPVALWITLPLVLFAGAWARAKRTVHPATGFVLAFTSAALCLKLLALLHPSKDLVDAVFHAHRLGAVLGGSFYFTQPMPGGVQFPYAIGLYVVAAPWASLITDHVALLRIVVTLSEALAGAALYAAVVRGWNDRLIGALAVVLYHVAPLPYVVIGNANLTYAFGQSVAVLSAALAVILTTDRRRALAAAALFGVTALAFLSHVGVFPILAVMLVATGGLYWMANARGLRPGGTLIVASTVLAAAFAIGAYYAHFPDVYRSLGRVTSASEAAAPPTSANPAAQPALTVGARAQRAGQLGLRGIGWPMLLLAGAGAWLATRLGRDRLTLALTGWGISFAVFVTFRTVAPVDARYQRYADEFIERVYYATLPAFAILAALAIAWAWRRGSAWRIAGVALGLACAVIGVRAWAAWIA
jgi:hypothetical protein